MRRAVSISGTAATVLPAASSLRRYMEERGACLVGVTLPWTPQVLSLICHPAPGCVLSLGYVEPCNGGAGRGGPDFGYDIGVLL